MTIPEDATVRGSVTAGAPVANREASAASVQCADLERPWLQSYPPDVPARLTYPRVPVGQLFDQLAPRFPGNDAFVFAGYGMSWHTLQATVRHLAMALQRLGVCKGNRVMLLLPNGPHFVIAYYASLKLGAVVVPSNPLYVERELDTHIRETSSEVLITLDVLYDKVAAIWQDAGVRHVILGTVVDFMPLKVRLPVRVLGTLRLRARGSKLQDPMNQGVHALGERIPAVRRLWELPGPDTPIPSDPMIRPFRSLLRGHGRLDPVEVDAEDLAVLLQTGGTTGTPKAVMLTHQNLIANAYQMRNWFPTMREGHETMLAPLPFFHGLGLTLTLNVALVLGARLILFPRIVAGDILDAIGRYRPSVLPGVPALFSALLAGDRLGAEDLRSLRWCVCGSSGLAPKLQVRLESLIGGRVYQGYGLTEASPTTHGQPHDGRGPRGCVGLPIPGTDARIVDEEGVPVSPGTVGELLVRGPQVMRGYWNRPAETAAVLCDGWLKTGDLARMDEAGYFFIVDRKKDMIKVSGESVYPAEIEGLLLQHPKVREAAVVGVPHPHRGEVPKAFIVLCEGEVATAPEVVAWLRERLAPFKVPRAVEFRETLPKSVLGKVLHRQLAADEAVKQSTTAAEFADLK